MSHSKPLLIPWLRTQIDSGRYPGVQWTNPEQTEFSVPWKHALRQDSSDTDILIFKAWAEVSGNGRAHGDASVWKRNFRSALRSKGFKMVNDKKNETADPHKVFHWPDESASGASSKSSPGTLDKEDPALFEKCGLPIQESQDITCFDDCLYLAEETVFAVPTINQDILQECLNELHIGPETEGTTAFEPVPEQQQLQEEVVIGGYALPGQQQYPVTLEGAGSETGLPEQPAHPAGGAVGGACGGQLVEQFLHTMNQSNDGDHFKTQFRVSVYYRGLKVMEHEVVNEAGLRLVYSPEVTGTLLDKESGLTMVFLPAPGAMSDQTQAKLTRRILDKLGGGLDVGVSGYVVYGQRRGEIKAFWSFSKFDSSQQPQEISKLQPQPLFMFKDFVRGIMDFINGRDCPPCSLFFCLGEKWPDPDNRPWEKKLITVEVVLTSMEMLKKLAIGGGASSLQSVELQMSLEEMMEMC
ncbi:interferon regulatory factor 3 [Paralichthys olivaceus]|uniref:Interferon regulatory factor 3 variant 1 n=1 Tax=Paralichthys olivaceus TaxID=8255 RepID=D4N6G3_PAROL|nr:PREDICTED: interferon regulatory factor 3-like [Paralichthys olivaceus]ACY69212.1 interferon regulatory factor 3 variant 1 [Paralichthys olivaceus]ACY69213.1 interferon regulatory factor 3 variant 2 [Paralichthys olivaceus]